MIGRYNVVALAGCLAIALSGCETTGATHAANVYKAGQVNTRQEVKTVNILAVLPAQIEVENAQARQTAQVVGTLLGVAAGAAVGNRVGNSSTSTTVGAATGAIGGAAAGSLVGTTKLVPGVSIAYEEGGQNYTSAQVGEVCEFVPGRAVMIATSPTETRIQPNATCPEQSKT